MCRLLSDLVLQEEMEALLVAVRDVTIGQATTSPSKVQQVSQSLYHAAELHGPSSIKCKQWRHRVWLAVQHCNSGCCCSACCLDELSGPVICTADVALHAVHLCST